MAKKEKGISIKMPKRLIEVGNLFSTIGGLERINRENFVLIKKNEIKTVGNGILAIYKFESAIGEIQNFTPIDSKMFFSKEEGDYYINQTSYNIKLSPANGTKSSTTTIPLVEHCEWDNIRNRNKHAALLIPSDVAIKELIGYEESDVIIRFKLFKEDLHNIEKWMGYFQHKVTDASFEICQEDDKVFIKVKDNNKNSRSEEIELVDGVSINKLPKNKILKVCFHPKYLFADDYTVTIYTNGSSEGRKIIFQGCNNDIMIFTSLPDMPDDILDEEMNSRLAEIDEDLAVDKEVQDEFEADEFDF
jgi:hypothetical protein